MRGRYSYPFSEPVFTRPWRILGSALLLYFVSLLFNSLLGVHEWLPHYSWRRALVPVPEASIVASLLFLTALYRHGGVRRYLFGLLSLILAFLSLFSVAEALFLHFYRRPFRLFPNLHLASNFFNMLFDTGLFSRPGFLLFPSAAFAVLYAFLWYLLLSGGARLFRFRPAGKILLAALLIGSSLGFSSRPYLSVRLATQLQAEEELANTGSAVYSRSRAGAESAAGKGEGGVDMAKAGGNGAGEVEDVGGEGGTVAAAAAAAAAAAKHYGLPGFEDADIHLFIVESYGMTVFSNPHQYARLEDFYRDMERRLEEAGFAALSWAYESTAFGGTSWLADASLITGLKIDTQHKYDRILEEGTHNLLHILADRGYRRIFSAPGSSYMDEKHRRFYDFSRYLLYDDFAYEGPYFAYGRMPDQYQLARAAEEIGLTGTGQGTKKMATDYSTAGYPAAGYSAADDPAKGYSAKGYPAAGEESLFVEYMLCSSHVPWNYIPPYLPDWEFPSNGRVYYDRSRNTYYEQSWTAGSEKFEGYAHSIRYSLESALGYIMRLLRDGEVVILVGDHQPAFPVSEKGASFAVPIHILSTDEDVIQPFHRFGYVEGLKPPLGENYPGIERFFLHFMSVAEGRAADRRPPGMAEGTAR